MIRDIFRRLFDGKADVVARARVERTRNEVAPVLARVAEIDRKMDIVEGRARIYRERARRPGHAG